MGTSCHISWQELSNCHDLIAERSRPIQRHDRHVEKVIIPVIPLNFEMTSTLVCLLAWRLNLSAQVELTVYSRRTPSNKLTLCSSGPPVCQLKSNSLIVSSVTGVEHQGIPVPQVNSEIAKSVLWILFHYHGNRRAYLHLLPCSLTSMASPGPQCRHLRPSVPLAIFFELHAARHGLRWCCPGATLSHVESAQRENLRSCELFSSWHHPSCAERYGLV